MHLFFSCFLKELKLQTAELQKYVQKSSFHQTNSKLKILLLKKTDYREYLHFLSFFSLTCQGQNF